jgi:class 3 adenylate cyclase/tetratricopeptide (TPR) repeat protein
VTPEETLLRSYVSTFLASQLLEDREPPTEPGSLPCEVAVIFADIAGFTPLAERLATLQAGTDQLSQMLDSYFGRLVALVSRHGGDVVTFAGDGLVAAWDADGGGRAEATSWAARCALAMQQTRPAEAFHEPRLSLRIGVGVGSAAALRVGGRGGQWQLLLSGEAVGQLGPAVRCAAVGEVVLSPAAAREVAGDAGSRTFLADGHWRIDAIHQHVASAPPWRVKGAASLVAVRACVPEVVKAHVAAGQGSWLSELRPISTVFVTLADVEATASKQLESVQILVSEVQAVLLECEGTLEKVVVDDKGVVLVAAFGLSPMAHRDDPLRAVRAALAVATTLDRRGLQPAVGVATGRAYCGPVGTDLHREYVILGDVANLAARLMQAAPGMVLCDERTKQAASSRAAFRSLPSLTLKGKSGEVKVYRPIATTSSAPSVNPRVSPFVGRVAELARLVDHMRSLQHGRSGIVAVSGESGIGKSRLVTQLTRFAASQGVRVLATAGDSIENGTPYHAWRPVYADLLGIAGLTEDGRQAAVAGWLGEVPELQARAPLLDPVLPVDLPDTTTTQHLIGQARAEATVDLLVELLASGPHLTALNSEPLLLVLDDAHWMDSASWAVARRALARISPLLLIVAGRPPGEGSVSEGYRLLLEEKQVDHLVLLALEADDANTLVGQLLPGYRSSRQVTKLVQSRAQGVPIFLEELAYALSDAGSADHARRIDDDLPDIANLDLLEVPESVHGVVAERIDRLAPAAQLTLKVASVIGPTFSQETLAVTHPLTIDLVTLRGCLDDLERQSFIVPQPTAAESVYRFRHALVQEVTYDRLLLSQRQPLHRSVAEWYEERRPNAHRVLAHHWSRAGAAMKATRCLELAGEQSLREGVYGEAADALERALLAAIDLRPAPSPQRQARWHRQLGDAYMGLGRLPESRDHTERALSLLGHALPVGPMTAAAELLGQLLRQFHHRLLSSPVRTADSGDVLEAARSYEHLAFLNYYANARVSSLASALHAVNLAETAPRSAELARGYAALGLGAGMLGLHPLARDYVRRAQRTARHVGDLPALTFVLMGSAAYKMSIGAWSEARTELSEGLHITESLRDERRWGELAALWSQVLYHTGQFDALKHWAMPMSERAEKSGDPQRRAHALLNEVCLALPQGDPEGAVERIGEVLELLGGRGAFADEIFAWGLLGQAQLHLGRMTLARAAAERAMSLITRSRPVAVHAVEGYAGAAEVLLGLWETGDTTAMSQAHRACAALRQFARAFPIGRPRAQLCTGLAASLTGKPDDAHAAWRSSLRTATHLAMPYEQGRAHLELARHLAPGTASRARHLEDARRIFGDLGAAHELERTRDTSER